MLLSLSLLLMGCAPGALETAPMVLPPALHARTLDATRWEIPTSEGHCSRGALRPALPLLELGVGELRWMGRRVIALEDREVPQEHLRGALITPLYHALAQSVEWAKDAAQGGCAPEFSGGIVIAADARLPWSVTRAAMYTAGQAQFGEFFFLADDPEPAGPPAGSGWGYWAVLLSGEGLAWSDGDLETSHLASCAGQRCLDLESWPWAALEEQARDRRGEGGVVLVPGQGVPMAVVLRAMDTLTYDDGDAPLLPSVILAGGAGDEDQGPPIAVSGQARRHRLDPHRLVGFPSAVPSIGAPASGQMDKEETPGGRGELKILTAVRGRGGGVRGAEVSVSPLAEALGLAPEPTPAAQTRDWFPETFLWQPLVETDRAGTAALNVPLPDALSEWQVLALAHDRAGAQAGAALRLRTALDLSVQGAPPSQLTEGDALEIPFTVRGDRDARVTLKLEAGGALEGGVAQDLDLSAGGSAVVALPVRASRAGEGWVSAEVVGEDRELRQIPVLRAGQERVWRSAGVLDREASVPLQAPPGALAHEVVVSPRPGAVGLFQDALAEGGARDGLATLYLLAHIDAIAARAGVVLEPAPLRSASLLAWQSTRALPRDATLEQRALTLWALRASDHPGAPSRVRATEGELLRAQRADGTWVPRQGAPVGEVVRLTALALRALPPARREARIRARGALERLAAHAVDARIAAILLASGVEGAPLGALLGQTEAPPLEEAAWRALALPGDPVALRQLLEAWAVPHTALAAELIAVDALVASLPPLGGPATLSLSQGDALLAELTLHPEGQAGRLSASLWDQDPLFLRSDRPGLAWSAAERAWYPWDGEGGIAGLDVHVEVEPGQLHGQQRARVTASGPSGATAAVTLALPPGYHLLDRGVGEALSDGRVRCTLGPFAPGIEERCDLVGVPEYRGTLHTSAWVEAEGARAALRPLVWEVR